MNWRNVKLGLCPIGKFVFSHADAVHYKEELQERLKEWKIKFIDLDEVVPDGLVRDQKHVERVVQHFQRQRVDALFMPHCNFGTEGAVGMIAQKLGVPVLLWGPRDEAPLENGTRLRDTLCGLFASSKVLHKLGVPFSYIDNCRLDEAVLKEGVTNFMRTASVVKAFKNLRIGMIGGRIDFFWTTKINESELLERFGIEILPIDLLSVTRRVKELVKNKRAEYKVLLKDLKTRIDFQGYDSDEPLLNLLALHDFYLDWSAENQLDVLCVESFPALCDELGSYDFPAAALAGDGGVPVICESDVHGAISTVLLESATERYHPSFFADLTVRHPENDNGILLWHCGAATSSVAKGEKIQFNKHWILPSPLSGSGHWRLKEGPLTIARFDGDHGKYSLIAGEGHTIDGPYTQNCYLWMEVDDWPTWERAFIEGPYIHHTAVVHDHCAEVLLESCKYLPEINADRRLL